MTKSKKHKGVKYWKDKAWKEFSKYIRLRDTSYLGTKCFSCGKYGDIRYMDAGHFQPGRYKVYLFDERQCHAQCKRCNVFLNGNWVEYEKAMIKEYGQDEVKKMKEARTQVGQWKAYELEEIYQKYKAKVKLYKNNNILT